jgi:hypothetical protein
MDDKEYFELTHHEDNVINHRLTWLLAGQPLLFLAYVNASVAPIPVKQELLPAHAAMLKWIPIVGIVMSLAIFVGVIGAACAMCVLKGRRASKVAGVTGFTTILGLTPPFAIPLILIWAWWSVLR